MDEATEKYSHDLFAKQLLEIAEWSSFRKTNLSKRDLEFIVEPWADQFTIAPGSTITVHYKAAPGCGGDDHIEHNPPYFSFYPDGNDYRVEIDGIFQQ